MGGWRFAAFFHWTFPEINAKLPVLSSFSRRLDSGRYINIYIYIYVYVYIYIYICKYIIYIYAHTSIFMYTCYIKYTPGLIQNPYQIPTSTMRDDGQVLVQIHLAPGSCFKKMGLPSGSVQLRYDGFLKWRYP